ncbi:MAG: 1-hydroxycarotenoid 3,4-desaturase CrtD [Vicingaceae bacterium]
MSRAIVIGAGIGGMASAIRMAAKGYEVHIYESNTYPGGKLTEIKKEGFRFDAGPSLFTMPELIEELRSISGTNHDFNYKKLDEVCRYFYQDGTVIQGWNDAVRFSKEAARATGIDQRKVVRHLNKSRLIYESTAHLFLEKSLHKIKSYLSFRTALSMFKLPLLNIFTTMNRANEKALANDKMIQLFNRYATYNGSDPYRAPGILNIIPHLEFSKGAFFPEGGMHSITNFLYLVCLEQKVTFHFKEKVGQIIVENGRALGIQTVSAKVTADLVICNMDVVPAYRKLMPVEKAPGKILEQERSSSALIFYWGIKATFEELILHNIFFTEDYKKEFEYLFSKNEIYSDPTVYINISSKEKSDDAKEGMENWFVMINAPRNIGQDWDSLILDARKNIIEKLSRSLGRDIASLIVTEEVLDPRSIESKTQSYQGSLYGTASNNKMAAFFRHPNFSRRIKGLYFCGGSVHPGGGIPLALSSAKIVDSMIKPALND